jgi:hypothetical protein
MIVVPNCIETHVVDDIGTDQSADLTRKLSEQNIDLLATVYSRQPDPEPMKD